MSESYRQGDLFDPPLTATDESTDTESCDSPENRGVFTSVEAPAPAVEVQPIDEAQREEVVARTAHYCHLAERLYRLRLPDLRVDFDLGGTTAGLFEVHGDEVRVRYNPWIFAKYYRDNLDNTVPHEVAHFVVHQRYRRRMKPHGPQWRGIMADFGADPAVTFRYDLSGIPTRRQRSHRYLCGCREHELSTTRHNRVQKGKAEYACTSCAGQLAYAPLFE